MARGPLRGDSTCVPSQIGGKASFRESQGICISLGSGFWGGSWWAPCSCGGRQAAGPPLGAGPPSVLRVRADVSDGRVQTRETHSSRAITDGELSGTVLPEPGALRFLLGYAMDSRAAMEGGKRPRSAVLSPPWAQVRKCRREACEDDASPEPAPARVCPPSTPLIPAVVPADLAKTVIQLSGNETWGGKWATVIVRG